MSLTPAERDRALLRLRRMRLWIAAGTVGLTALGSAAAAVAFRGHRATSVPPAIAAHSRAAPSGPGAIPLPPSASGDDPALQPPPAPPAPAPSEPAQTTSGGT